MQDALAQWARGDERARGVVRQILLGHQAHSAARVGSASAGVERLVLHSGQKRTRAAAVNALLSSGSSIVASFPLAGSVGRARSLYSASADRVVRIIIVQRMQEQAERAEAIEFLASVVVEGDALAAGFEGSTVSFAIDALNRMGPEGPAALRQLHDDGKIHGAGALSYLKHLGIVPPGDTY